MNETFVEVVLPLPLRQPLIYRVPDSLREATVPGRAVKVPLGSKRLIGYVLQEAKKPDFLTKEILEILPDHPDLSPRQLKLIRWASAYYLTPPGEVLRHLIPAKWLHLKEEKIRVSNRKLKPFNEVCDDFIKPAPLELTPRQKQVLQDIQAGLNPSIPILLHGVTGSGKTEIYMEIARQVVSQGGQVLVMVPEIGLTPQLVARFHQGIPLDQPLAAYHSALTLAQRLQVWTAVREGRSPLVIATRSGIFLPFPNLQLIIIDEEHDPSYKQEERFCYHARDLALWIGNQEKFPVILGSATPSLESLQRAEIKKMTRIRLTERPAGVVLPTIEIIDRRIPSSENSHPFIADKMLEALEETFKKGEQSLLFINRRGFASFVLCPACGFVPRCQDCDISLTLHKENTPVLLCHYCDDSIPYQPLCSQCHSGTLTPLGSGTERIHLDLKKLFPRARVERIDRDTAKGGGWLKILKKMKRGEIDILIGTQMITKGHDYPNLTLVGILDADLALHLPDFRASERTFQMVTQVSGRSGRSEKPGRVLIQTYHPDHESLIAAQFQGEKDFYRQELQTRQEAGYPPFKRLVEIRLSGQKRDSVIQHVRLLARKIQKQIPERLGLLLGPSPCTIEKVRGHRRWRLLLKTSAYTKIQPQLRHLLDDFIINDLPSTVKVLVNVDPVEML